MSEPKLVIKQQKSARWHAGWVIGGLIILALTYWIGGLMQIKQQRQTDEKVSWLEQQLEEYRQAYQKANQDLVMQAQSAKVDNQSSQQLIATIKQLQETQQKLEEELGFYRNIMAPELARDGLTIADFELTRNGENSPPRFKLVLTQAGKQEQFLKGKVSMKLHGKKNGSSASYEFRELGTFQPKHFQFQFKYFQNIEGELNLPDGFIAEKISITARTSGLRKNQISEKQVDWNI